MYLTWYIQEWRGQGDVFNMMYSGMKRTRRSIKHDIFRNEEDKKMYLTWYIQEWRGQGEGSAGPGRVHVQGEQAQGCQVKIRLIWTLEENN